MEFQTGDLPGLDGPPVAFTKTGVVSQMFATFTTTNPHIYKLCIAHYILSKAF